MNNWEKNNSAYNVGDPENSEIEYYLSMPEENEDVATEEKDDAEGGKTAVEKSPEEVKTESTEDAEVETEDTAEAVVEEPVVEAEPAEAEEEKNLDEPSEEAPAESDTVEEQNETIEAVENVEEPVEVSAEKTVEEQNETENSPTAIEMDPEEATHLAMQTKIVQATYGDIRKDLPAFRSGDTLSVGYRVIEGSRSRVQSFEGVVIKISSGHGLDKTFTVRKISGGIGVERIFPLHSPNIESIKVLKEGKVRRAKLYYLRGLKGKATRIKERVK